MSNEIDIIYRRLAEQKGRIEALEKALGSNVSTTCSLVDRVEILESFMHDELSSPGAEGIEQKPVDAPTREAVADVANNAYPPHMNKSHSLMVADAILAAFGPKLGRQLTEDDWYMILSDTCTLSKEDETAPKNLMVVLAKAVVAKLAELKQDVKMVVSAIPTVSDHPNRFQLASIIGKTMSAWQSSSDDLRIADAILAAFGPKLSSMPTAEQMHQKWNTCDGPGVRESWVQFHAWLAELSQPIEVDVVAPTTPAGDYGPDCPGNPVVNAPATYRTVGSPAPTVVIAEKPVPVVNPPPDAGIEERAKRLIVVFDDHYRFEDSSRKADWLAVSRAVEDEIRAAKQEALKAACMEMCVLCNACFPSIRMLGDLAHLGDNCKCTAIPIRRLIADLDAEADHAK